MGRRVLITGVSGYWGSELARSLERLPEIEYIAGLDVRPPARALTIAAEAMAGSNGGAKPVAIILGPENGAVSERLVYEAAREARAKNYAHLYVIGFAIEPNARQLIDQSAQVAIAGICRLPASRGAGFHTPHERR